MPNIKVSVIIPAYNAGEQILRCVNSIINQTLKEIEIIIIDDGSTDNTLELVNNIKLIDSRIIAITQENKKQGAARNRGIEIAQGEYIGFVDSDDYIDTDYYEKLYNSAVNNNCDIATTNILKHKRKYNKYNVFHKNIKIAETIKGKYKLCEDKTHRFFYVINKIFKTSTIKSNNILFPEECYFEDVMFSTKAIFYSKKIIAVPNTNYHYIENINSTINSNHNKDKKLQDHILNSVELQKFAKEKNITLPERLNYTNSYWTSPFIKTYKGLYKIKKMLFGIIPIYIKKFQ